MISAPGTKSQLEMEEETEERMAKLEGHPVLAELLKRIAAQETKHVAFYASQARDRLAKIVSSHHGRPQWLATLSWGAVGASLAITLAAIGKKGNTFQSKVPPVFGTSALGFSVMSVLVKIASTRLPTGEIVLNVMNADGTTAGYDLEMTAAVSDAVTSSSASVPSSSSSSGSLSIIACNSSSV